MDEISFGLVFMHL